MQKPDSAFDKFIEHFSIRELKARVRVVIVVGIIICAAAIVGGWALLSHNFFVADEPGLRSVPYRKMILRSP
jgi:hypothetical protein